MTGSLLVTVIIEGVIVLGYAAWHKKPAGRLLLASIIANLGTQSALWLALNSFPAHYMATLLLAEAVIWPAEGLCLHAFPGTRLGWSESMLLSLAMNAASFSLGWFLPV